MLDTERGIVLFFILRVTLGVACSYVWCYIICICFCFILESPTKKPVKSKEFISSSSDDDEGPSTGKLSLADSLIINKLFSNWCK